METESYHSISIIHHPNFMGPTKKNCVWLDLLILFQNWDFQKLKTEFQWHNGKYFDFVEPICSELSNHIQSLWYYRWKGIYSVHFSSSNISESLFLTSLSLPPSHFFYTPFPAAFEMMNWRCKAAWDEHPVVEDKQLRRGKIFTASNWALSWQFFTPHRAKQFLSPSFLPFARSVHLSP